MNLHLKYRPNNFEQVYGNDAVIATLKNIIGKEDKPHSYLFHGDTGCGKTTLGRIIANELGCKGSDLREVDSADFRGIDTIRGIRKQSQYRPLESPCKVWILDECHKMSNDAQNALLKALEDTPKHVYYILCTTDPDKLLKTIRGRCSSFQVSPLLENEMKKLLRHVVKSENDKLDKKTYEQIIQDSQGRPREALQILAQVLCVEPENRLEVAKQQAEKQSQTIELCRALLSGVGGWKKVSNILNGLKTQDPESIRRAVLGYCSSVLLKEENNQAAIIMEEFNEPFYNNGFPGLVFACYSIVCAE
jgi:DNA polymerase-3 subunit gamma/tau